LNEEPTAKTAQLNSTTELVETAVSVPEEGYWSGGGFSNYWPAPSYQESTLRSYFENTPPPYTNTTAYGTPYYNSSGRGYPDVAAVGQNILLYVQGAPSFVGGTSASAPIFASIITLINEKRLAAGKSTVGFINPVLYQNPDAFKDVSLRFLPHLFLRSRNSDLINHRSPQVITQAVGPTVSAPSRAGIQSQDSALPSSPSFWMCSWPCLDMLDLNTRALHLACHGSQYLLIPLRRNHEDSRYVF
jgi:hypothetical protein